MEENPQTAIYNCRYLIKVTYYQQEGVLTTDSVSYRDPLLCYGPDLVRILIHLLKKPHYKIHYLKMKSLFSYRHSGSFMVDTGILLSNME